MIEEAVNSKVKSKIVKFLSQQNGEFQVSDLAKVLNISKSRASETLRDLADIGILSRRAIGRSVLYKFSSNTLAKTLRNSMNSENIILENIENDVIKETRWLRPIGIVRFGSSLRNFKLGSDVDFIIIYKGKTKNEKVYDIIGKLSAKFGIHISIILVEADKFISKVRSGDEFALNVMAGKLVHGKNLEEIVWPAK